MYTKPFVWQPSAASLFKITVLSSALAALGITTGCSSTPQSAKPRKQNRSVEQAILMQAVWTR